MHNLVSLTLIAFLAAVPVVRGQSLTPGAACPPGGGSFCASSFSNIILSCSTNGTDGVLVAGNCNDNLAGVAPVGVKTDAICGNSTANNAACYLPPYPPFITTPGTTTTSSAGSTTSTLTVTSTTSSVTVIPGNGTTTITTSVGPTTTPAPTTSTSATNTVPVFSSGAQGIVIPMAVAGGVAVAMLFGMYL